MAYVGDRGSIVGRVHKNAGWKPALPVPSLRFQQDLHYVFFLGVGDGFGGFAQGEGAGDEGARVDFGVAEEAEGFGERTAAGADDGEFLDYDGPGFDRGGAVEGGFQDQGAARLGDVLSEG
jgi:hypothetical protein